MHYLLFYLIGTWWSIYTNFIFNKINFFSIHPLFHPPNQIQMRAIKIFSILLLFYLLCIFDPPTFWSSQLNGPNKKYPSNYISENLMAEKREMGSMCKKNLKNILQKLQLCFFSKQYIYIIRVDKCFTAKHTKKIWKYFIIKQTKPH